MVEGGGTPAPVAPTDRLVVGGLYRHVRNPMYVAVGATIAGQALLLGRPVLLGYLAVFWLAVASFVRFYEEPTLSERYGEQYAAYKQAVPAWRPRLRPWTAGASRGCRGGHVDLPRVRAALRQPQPDAHLPAAARRSTSTSRASRRTSGRSSSGSSRSRSATAR